ncbi:MAG: hypothetical protein SFY67_03960 [Candidatus Melainabacteria bacterium]|nr:hypothetical protein [Candidatus Melainabacteria bacterium]
MSIYNRDSRRGENNQMHPEGTTWQVFILIVLGWLAAATFIFGGRKLYFEPFKSDAPDESPKSAE